MQAENGHANNPANPAFSEGWTHFNAGTADAHANHVNALRTESGYLYGVLRTPAPIVKREGDPLGAPNKRFKPM
jgi:hypothetical protein